LDISSANAGLEFFWLRDAKVTANLNRQVVVDFAMPWDSTSSVCGQMTPPRMAAAFAE
jgi:hypothetical protein